MCSLGKAADPLGIFPKDTVQQISDPLKIDPASRRQEQQDTTPKSTLTITKAAPSGGAQQPSKTNSVSAQLGLPTQ